MKKNSILIISLIAAVLALAVGIIVANAEPDSEDWIEIYTVEDLYSINNDLTANYILMDDIDLTEATAPGGDWDYMGNGWNPIGSNNNYGKTDFSGVFDGNGYSINGMRVEVTPSTIGVCENTVYIGLFSSIGEDGIVKNLKIDGVINVKTDRKYLKLGTIAGICSGDIENCYCSVSIDCYYAHNYFSLNKDNAIGGLVGLLSEGNIRKCINSGDINVLCHNTDSYYSNQALYFRMGGIAGSGVKGEVSNCINTGNVSVSEKRGTLDKPSFCAGIIGDYENVIVSSCYNCGVMTYGDKKGYAIACGQTNNCYFLSGTGEQSTGSTSLTPAQMKLQSMYAGFDFEETWMFYVDTAYPYPQLISNPIDTESIVSEIEITQLPNKLSFIEGKDNLTTSGGKITIYYKDGSSEVKNITNSMVSGFDNTVAGTQELTVAFGRSTTTYTVNITPKAVSGISMNSMPDKTQYIEGYENLNLTGGTILVSYNNGTSEVIDLSDADVTGFNNSVVGEQTLTVSYGNKTTSFNVNIVAKTIVSVEMNTLPLVTEYLEGKGVLDVAGAKIKVKYNNNTEELVNLTDAMVSGFSNKKIGNCRITVTYNSFTTYFNVTIIAKSIASISMNTMPTKLEYLEMYDSLSLDGGSVLVSYNNGTETTLALTFDMVSGFDNTLVGNQTLTVVYEGFVTTFDVRIKAKSPVSIQINNLPSKVEYVEGKDALDISNGKVKINYNNGTGEIIDLTANMITGFDNTTVGNQTLTVTVSGLTATFNVNVVHDYFSETIPPTCTEAGYITYTCSQCGADLVIEGEAAHGHDYVFEAFVWDGLTAQAKCVCRYDSNHVEWNVAEVSSKVKLAPTCTEDGITTYTAEFNGNTESRDETDINALGHDYVLDSFVWEGIAAKAKIVCKNDPDHFYYEDAVVEITSEEGITIVTARSGIYSESKSFNSSGDTSYIDSTGPRYELSNVTGMAGNTIEVFVSINNNPGIASLRNTFYYDEEAMELIEVENTGLLNGYTTPYFELSSPYTLRWADSLAEQNNDANGNVVKLTFKIKETTSEGSYPIMIVPVESRNVIGQKINWLEALTLVKVIDYVVGDSDGDGEVTDWDAMLFERYLVGWSNVELNLEALDLDEDGEITDWDAMLLNRYLAGWDIILPGH